MIDRYLDKGRMYILNDNGIKCECVVTVEGNGVLEIKNIATVPEYQGKGYAKALIDFLVNRHDAGCMSDQVMQVPLPYGRGRSLAEGLTE